MGSLSNKLSSNVLDWLRYWHVKKHLNVLFQSYKRTLIISALVWTSTLFDETTTYEHEHQISHFFKCAMLFHFFSVNLSFPVIFILNDLIGLKFNWNFEGVLGKLRINNKNTCNRILFSETKQWNSVCFAGSRRIICQWFVVFVCLKQLQLRNIKGHWQFFQQN